MDFRQPYQMHPFGVVLCGILAAGLAFLWSLDLQYLVVGCVTFLFLLSSVRSADEQEMLRKFLNEKEEK